MINELKNRAEKGVAIFDNGYNCAQAVLKSLCDVIDLDPDTAVKLATGFGSGMSRTQNVCGAVSGGILALNQAFGRNPGESKDTQEKTYEKVRRLVCDVEKEIGSVVCREILDGCDLSTEEGQARFLSENMREKCKDCVRTAIRSVEKMILNG